MQESVGALSVFCALKFIAQPISAHELSVEAVACTACAQSGATMGTCWLGERQHGHMFSAAPC